MSISKPALILGAALALTAGLVKIMFLQDADERRESHEPLPPAPDTADTRR